MFKGEVVRALGAMSGTSLDGVDAAELVTDGHRILEFGETGFRPYSAAEQKILRAALGQWSGDAVDTAQELVETAHAQVLSSFDAVELIGFHGQTLAHDPAAGRSLQVGDGQILAEVLQKPVVWDFRSADIQLGGQGAPLAPFFHFALAKWLDLQDPVGFLNLGGVGNLTWVDPRCPAPETRGALLAFDTGPANAPLNDLMQLRGIGAQDVDGALAAKGTPDQTIITAFLGHPHFFKAAPKSLDRDAFAHLPEAVAELGDADAAATLTAAAALAVSEAISLCPSPPTRIFVCGGGRRNPTLMAMIAANCPCPVTNIDDQGLDGDMIEAQAFAYLAVRVAKGLPTSCPATTGVRAAVSGGTISRPMVSLA